MNKIGSLCLLLLISNEASSLSCNHCYDEIGSDSCNKKVQVGQCNPILVSDLHRNLENFNPNLLVEPPPSLWGYTYQCYELAIRFKYAQGSSSVMYEQGCTYHYTMANFCDGWDMSLLEEVNCTTKSTGVPDVDDGAVEDSKAGSMPLSGSVCVWLMVVMLIFSLQQSQ